MKKEKTKTSFFDHHPEARGILLLALCAICTLSLLSFHPKDPSASWLGLIGYSIGWLLTFLFGIGSYFLVGYLGFFGIKKLKKQTRENEKIKHIYFGCFLISFCIVLNLCAELNGYFPDLLKQKVFIDSIVLHTPYPQIYVRHNLGGIPLYYLYADLATFNLKSLLSNVGIGITFTFIAIVSSLLLTETKLSFIWQRLCHMIGWIAALRKSNTLATATQEPLLHEDPIPEPLYSPSEELAEAPTKRAPRKTRKTKKDLAIEAQRVFNGDFSKYKLPPPTLLNPPKKADQSSLQKDLRRQAALLEETLMSFGIEAKVGDIHCGPTITSFEVHPSVGVKVQKIKALENDIALNLQAKSIRIIAPIPGKAAVGIEIPSPIQQEVNFRELLQNYQAKKSSAQIPILLGKTVSGEIVMSDLAKMPHCIIAGATGSGKSVCINTIVMSIVMNASPDEIKLLMVDPKKVELTGYTNLPHMIAPVITEAHGAYAALQWLVKEMQLRYEILKQLGLRNISAFNSRKRDVSFEESLDIEIPERMPKMVAIIDEFADLMMASSSDLETPIARIAQMARAVGIHMILATQRPSREVITGLIKANFPTRISFKVASRINSSIILDETGAENLLGNGDMLFLPPGSSHLLRAQGTYISDSEINKIIDFACNQAPPNYLIPSFDHMPQDQLSTIAGVEDGKDSLYDNALSIVVETGSASTTFLQRKLKIGYARAASLMDELEANGVISPQEGAKPRRVLIQSPQSKE